MADNLAPDDSKMKHWRGVTYFADYDSAVRAARWNGWPTDRIIQYGKGWAVQSKKSGPYLHLLPQEERVLDMLGGDRERESNPGVRQIGRHVYDYDSANRFLDGKNSRKLAHNTLVHRDRPGDAIRVRYHNTDVVTYHLGGSIELNSGGYQTVTTKQRMNQLLPPGHGVYQYRHEWFVQTPNGSYPFEDGAHLYPGSSMEYETPEESRSRFREGR